MAQLILFNKPYNVLSQFTDRDGRATLAITSTSRAYTRPGRLDYDSEGLLLLTDDGALAHQLTTPARGPGRPALVQVENIPGDAGSGTASRRSSQRRPHNRPRCADPPPRHCGRATPGALPRQHPDPMAADPCSRGPQSPGQTHDRGDRFPDPAPRALADRGLDASTACSRASGAQ